MAEPRSLRNPPVTEAVVDIIVEFPSPVEVPSLKRMQEAIKAQYPEQQQMQDVEFNVEIGVGTVTSNKNTLTNSGFVYISGDKKQVVQCRRTGLAFSRLAPYWTWEDNLAETMRLWRIYLELFRPSKVVRVSTRFINKLELPGPDLDFDDYLTITPRTPSRVRQVVGKFLIMQSLPVTDQVIAQLRCMYDGTGGEKIPVVLDLDIIKPCAIAATDESSVVAALNELRPIKNDVFFGSLTDKALDLYA